MKFRYDKENEELVVSEATRIEYQQMSLWLSRHVKGWKFHPLVKNGIWDGKQNFFRNGKINLGLWKEALKGCQEIGMPFILDNKEDFPLNRDITLEKVQEFCKEFFKDHKVKKDGQWIPFMPYEHQIDAAYKILKNRFVICEVATSGGKSLIISIVMFYTLKHVNPDAKFLLIVPSITLVTQFYENIAEYNFGVNFLSEKRENKISCDIRVEEVMSEKPRKYSGTENANIYIGTYQSLEKWPKQFFKKFHTVVTDEAHGAKSKTISTILNHTFKSAYSRFGVSGTFPSDESCEILNIQSLMGPKITEVSADELRTKGIITPMDIRSVIMNHNDEEFHSRLKLIRKAGEGKAAFDLEKAYIHQSTKRLDFIAKIINKCDNNTLLLFHTIENGKKIFKHLSEQFPDKEFFYIDGEISGKKRNEILKNMEVTTGSTKILVASFGTLSTGVSVNAIFNIVFADSFKSESIILQSIGRGLRLHLDKQKVNIFDLVDVFSPTDFSNALYRHYEERKGFYNKRKYPYKEIKVNL